MENRNYEATVINFPDLPQANSENLGKMLYNLMAKKDLTVFVIFFLIIVERVILEKSELRFAQLLIQHFSLLIVNYYHSFPIARDRCAGNVSSITNTWI